MHMVLLSNKQGPCDGMLYIDDLWGTSYWTGLRRQQHRCFIAIMLMPGTRKYMASQSRNHLDWRREEGA